MSLEDEATRSTHLRTGAVRGDDKFNVTLEKIALNVSIDVFDIECT